MKYEWNLNGEYGFLKNILMFIIIPIIGIYIMMILFNKNREITDNLAKEYDYKIMIQNKVQKFIMNIPNMIMNNNLTMETIGNYIWTDNDKKLLSKINEYDKKKNKLEFRLQLTRLSIEIIIFVMIINSLFKGNTGQSRNKLIYIILIEIYIALKIFMVYIKMTYPSLTSFIISEYFINQYRDDKTLFYLGDSLVNFTFIGVMLFALRLLPGFKDVHFVGWHIILIASIFIYNIASSIYTLKKLNDWEELDDNDINLGLINYLLISKQKGNKFDINEFKLILMNGMRNGFTSLFNIVSDEDKSEVIKKMIKSIDDESLNKLMKEFRHRMKMDGDSSSDDFPDMNIIDGIKSDYKKWKDVNIDCFTDLTIPENLLKTFGLWIWNFEDVLIDTNAFYRMKMDPDEIRGLTDKQLELQVPHWKYYKSLVRELVKNGIYVGIVSFGVDYIIDAYMSRIFGYDQKYFIIGTNLKTIPRNKITGEPDVRDPITNKIPMIKELMDQYRIRNYDRVIMFDDSIQNLACVREVGVVGIKIGENDGSVKQIDQLNPNNLFHGGMVDYLSVNLDMIMKNNKFTRYGSIGGLKASKLEKSKKIGENKKIIGSGNGDASMSLDDVINRIKCKKPDDNDDDGGKQSKTLTRSISTQTQQQTQQQTPSEEEESQQQTQQQGTTSEEGFSNIHNIQCNKCNTQKSIQLFLMLIIIIIIINSLRKQWNQNN